MHAFAVSSNHNSSSNNDQDNVYSAVITAEPLQEFARFM